MEQDILFGLWAVALGAVCVALGMLTKGLAQGLKLQADMLKCLGELTKVFMQGVAQSAMMATNNWRELPPDARLMLRNSLVEVLAEMDKEMPTRH